MEGRASLRPQAMSCGGPLPVQPAGDSPERQPDVVEQMGELHRNVCWLEETIEHLASRLEPVLSPPPPSSENEADKEPPTKLGADIRHEAVRVRRLNRTLRFLLDRLEL
jgi:hypothetical protein